MCLPLFPLVSSISWMFVKKFEGKAELFVRRWESSFIPKLRKIAALEKGVVSSLLDQAGDQKDGKQFTFYECFAPSFCVNII